MTAWCWIGLLSVLALAVVWFWQIHTPRRVRWRDDSLAGQPVRRADDLVLLYEEGETVWAGRGYTLYRSDSGGDFRKVARVRPPRGEAWGGYVRYLRRRFGYQELMEIVRAEGDVMVVFAGGVIMRLDLTTGRSETCGELRYFGRGKGRGLMPHGLERTPDGTLFFGEYMTAKREHEVALWKSTDHGRSWAIAYEFPMGAVRHIHAVHFDTVDECLWLCTGDLDEACHVGVSHDGGSSFEWLVSGNQMARTCSLSLFEDAVVWGSDTDFVENHVVVWSRGERTHRLADPLPDVTYYSHRIDGSCTALSLAQHTAAVWIASANGAAREWVSWDVPPTLPKRGPSPSVRLARGACSTHLHVNPLRTNEHEAAIFRIPLDQVPRP